MAFVFLSYAHSDSSYAQKLAADLHENGIDIWSDRVLVPGTVWANEISRKIDEATAVVVLISADSLASEYVTQEWVTALSKSRRVIPVLIRKADITGLPETLGGQVIDLTADYDAGFNRLITELRALERSQEPPATASFDKNEIVRDVIESVLERLKVERIDLSPTADELDDKLIFVIAPFLPDMEPAFEAIKAAAIAVGLRAQRVKDVTGDYKISDKMLMMIRKARFIVADLTHERPNVYFELGYARGLGKTVITIMREDTKVHFDVQDWTYLSYIDSRPLERDLIERLNIELSPPQLPT